VGLSCPSDQWCSESCQCVPWIVSSSSSSSSITVVLVSSSSSRNFCGDSYLADPEQCEVTVACPSRSVCVNCLCQPVIACGDGFLDPDEECDDGNLWNGDGCNALCMEEWTEGGSLCGNNVTESSEQCDDGNRTAFDGCSASCQWETRLAARCGDGFLDPAEECDDGNLVNSDECTIRCLWTDLGSCGNHIIELPKEECDDGDTVDHDGCSARCQWEDPIVASTGPVCGDGIVALPEQCDDGLFNGFPGNPCGSDCLFTVIGCTDSSQCLAGYVCVDGQCGSCTVNNQCPTNLCILGVCSSCTANDQCPTRLCRDGMCVPCSADDDCEWGQTCRSGSCLPCAEDNQCTTGRCSTGACLPCTANDQCWTGLCLNGICTVCSSNDQCAAGQLCRAGWCIDVPMQIAGAMTFSSVPMMTEAPHAADTTGESPLLISSSSSSIQPVRRPDSITPLFATLRVFEPLTVRTVIVPPQGPAGETGPASIAVMAAGAAAGFAWMRRRRK
jgi:cysteine-rich repeat protein